MELSRTKGSYREFEQLGRSRRWRWLGGEALWGSKKQRTKKVQ